MALQMDLQTVWVPEITRIPLSDILNPQDAVERITQAIIHIHQINQHENFPHPYIAIIGHDTEVLWNVLLHYYRGDKVDLISGEDYVVNEHFVVPQTLVNELIGWLIEVDIPAQQVALLDKDHPYTIIKEVLDTYEAKRSWERNIATGNVIEDEGKALAKQSLLEQERNAFNRCTMLVATIVRNIYDQDDDLMRYRSDPKEIIGNLVLLENGKKIEADFVFTKEYVEGLHGVAKLPKLEDQSLNYPVLNDQDGKKIARDLLHYAMRSEDSLNQYQQALKDFTDRTSLTGEKLIKKIQQDRPFLAQEQRPRVTVIGLGPTGLLATIRAYQQGAMVTAVEKHDLFHRDNPFRLTPLVKEEIEQLFGHAKEDISKLPADHPLRIVFDDEFNLQNRPMLSESRLLDELVPFSFRDLEFLLLALIHLIQKNDPEGMHVYFRHAYVPFSLQTSEKSLEIMDEEGHKKKIATDVIVGADGYQSQCRKDAGINVDKLSSPLTYAVYSYPFMNKETQGFFEHLFKSNPPRRKAIKKLKSLGWHHHHAPIVRFFYFHNQACIGVEVPDHLSKESHRLLNQVDKANQLENFAEAEKFNQENAHLINNWYHAVMDLFLNDDPRYHSIVHESRLFHLCVQKANTASTTTPSKMKVLLIGDAAQFAHFQTGCGLAYAIAGAKNVAHFIKMIVTGTSKKEASKTFENLAKKQAVGLVDWAFTFPTQEEFNLKPTAEYYLQKKALRVEQIKERLIPIKNE